MVITGPWMEGMDFPPGETELGVQYLLSSSWNLFASAHGRVRSPVSTPRGRVVMGLSVPNFNFCSMRRPSGLPSSGWPKAATCWLTTLCRSTISL